MRDRPIVDKATGFAMIIWTAMIVGLLFYVT